VLIVAGFLFYWCEFHRKQWHQCSIYSS